MVTGGTFHRKGIEAPRWKVFFFNGPLIETAGCSFRPDSDIAVWFQAVLPCANPARLCGRWTGTALIPGRWWGWTASIGCPCSPGPQDKCKRRSLDGADPCGIESQDVSSCVTSWGGCGELCLLFGETGFTVLPPLFFPSGWVWPPDLGSSAMEAGGSGGLG